MWFELKGDARLGQCASEKCGGQPTWRLEASGVGSNYCSGCKSKIEAEQYICKKCRRHYVDDDEDADEHGTGLCYECFEDGVEEADIRRRERIARANEY